MSGGAKGRAAAAGCAAAEGCAAATNRVAADGRAAPGIVLAPLSAPLDTAFLGEEENVPNAAQDASIAIRPRPTCRRIASTMTFLDFS